MDEIVNPEQSLLTAAKQIPEGAFLSQDLEQALSLSDTVVRMKYLASLGQADIIPYDNRNAAQPAECVKLIHITCITYDSEKDIADKLAGVFSSISEYDSTAVFIVKHDGEKTDIYMGTANDNPEAVNTSFQTLKRAVNGYFPGCSMTTLFTRHNEALLNELIQNDTMTIASVSAVGGAQDSKGTGAYIQGIEKLVDGMRGHPFYMIVLASALAKETIVNLCNGYENLYTQLAPFSKIQQTISDSDANGNAITTGTATTDTKSRTTGKSQASSYNEGHTVTSSRSQEEENEKLRKIDVISQITSVASLLSLGGKASLATGLWQGSIMGNSVSRTIQSVFDIKPVQVSESNSDNFGKSDSESTHEEQSDSASVTNSSGETQSSTHTAGMSTQYTYENRTIGSILSAIDENISRLNLCEGTGAFQCAAYIFAGDTATARMGANMYRALLSQSSVSTISHINMWNDKENTQALCDYLQRMKHPLFSFRNGIYGVTAATISSSNELSQHFIWPRKSIPGLMVDRHAEFARDVITKRKNDSAAVRVGSIMHMGNVEKCEVLLNLEECSKHLFISGTTGSGKSNFCYRLLSVLREHAINFLVIEPAKGEYINVFGGRSDVNVFGTNKRQCDILSINPFSFPKEIHILEHMDRIIEVFNASWPMYAAMPAILKESIEKAYENYGWNLEESFCIQDPPKFPTFADLLTTLPEILKQTEYSKEVQGNYIGSLVTRVKSMTNGICGQIFCSKETPSVKLYNDNAIVDISRIGSSETKSLIMGLLVIKLQEHRQCEKEGMNQKLKHVTLLEEAHHLLRATSMNQSMEGSNLRGMSVEILTNAIAEMRTYGESFIIADQSPTIMDQSVVRNTSTKVIFRLPEENDRQIVGKAISLHQDQIDEIARLDTGVAVICQSSWTNPVLCKIDYFDPANYRPMIYESPQEDRSQIFEVRGRIMELVMSNRTGKNVDIISKVSEYTALLSNSKNFVDKELLTVLSEFKTENKLKMWSDFSLQCQWTDRIIKGELLFTEELITAQEWHKKGVKHISSICMPDDETIKAMLSMLLMKRGSNKSVHQFYFKWYAYSKELKMQSEG